VEDLAPTTREYLETTLSSARSLLQILNDILDMSKIEAGKLTIEEKPFSLQGCLTDTVEIITPEVRRKGLDFAISVAQEIPETVVGDHARLRQILLNLIGNAVKFTESGKVEVRVTAGRMTSDGRRECTFAVSDTGIGIPDDKVELLFHTFSQVDSSHSRIYGGTGLGLAICRELVELMGGTISFESQEGVGSTFSFTIPFGQAKFETSTLTAATSRSPEKITIPKGKKIPRLLIAEDEPNTRKVLGSFLKLMTNFKFDFAEDGRKAVEMWEKGDYDLILMDVQMPRLDGFKAARAIREKELERGGRSPIVAMTAHTHKEDEKRCLAAGMDAFISKPIDFMVCLQLIEQIITQNSSGVN
ncbi:MAG: response regulator, partial [Desulfuromonadales bacterium]|nr:response regulator [Desulfuromonadales bacterium]